MTTITVYAPDPARLLAASAVQAMLPRLVALALDVEQAHWNVTSPGPVQSTVLIDRPGDGDVG